MFFHIIRLWISKVQRSSIYIDQPSRRINLLSWILTSTWHWWSLNQKPTCIRELTYIQHEKKKGKKSESVSHSVLSDSLLPQGLQPTRLLCPWDSPGKNTGVGRHSLLQGIFPTQGLNQGLLHCRQILYHLRHQGSSKQSIALPKLMLYFSIVSVFFYVLRINVFF